MLAEVEAAAEAAGGWDGVEAIAVGLGPGSFTGLRVGIASARGIAASLDIELRGVCTLDALARALDDAPPGAGDLNRLALIDARRGEVFAALYTPAGERLWDPWVGDPDALLERLSTLEEAPLAAGSGALRFRDELAGRGVRIADGDADLHRVAARHVCGLAAAGADREPLAPIYLRPPDAERWHERDHPKRAE